MSGPITRRRFIGHAVVGTSAVASIAAIDHRRAWAAPLAQDGTVQTQGLFKVAEVALHR